MPHSLHEQTTSDGTTLIPSPQLRRMQHVMQDLIIAAYERCTNRPGKSLVLVGFQYAYDDENGEKCCTHYDALVRDLDRNESIALTLTFAANKPLNEGF